MIGRVASSPTWRAARFVLALFMLLALPASMAHAHDFSAGQKSGVELVAHEALAQPGTDHHHQGPEGGAPHAGGLDCCLHHAPAVPLQDGPALPLRFEIVGDRVIGPQDMAPDGAPKTRLERPPRSLPSI